MKEKPIIFSTQAVRAILDGRKTQTRRVIKPEWYRCLDFDEPEDINNALVQCPYGQIGDRLWVRETWGAISPDEELRPLSECRIEYRADLPVGSTDYPGGWPADEAHGNDDAPKWRSSIHMPRWASRITLEIVDVRVEKLQNITCFDCTAEGVHYREVVKKQCTAFPQDYHRTFAELWDEINAKRGYSWASNPWVWVISFRSADKGN